MRVHAHGAMSDPAKVARSCSLHCQTRGAHETQIHMLGIFAPRLWLRPSCVHLDLRVHGHGAVPNPAEILCSCLLRCQKRRAPKTQIQMLSIFASHFCLQPCQAFLNLRVHGHGAVPNLAEIAFSCFALSAARRAQDSEPYAEYFCFSFFSG